MRITKNQRIRDLIPGRASKKSMAEIVAGMKQADRREAQLIREAVGCMNRAKILASEGKVRQKMYWVAREVQCDKYVSDDERKEAHRLRELERRRAAGIQPRGFKPRPPRKSKLTQPQRVLKEVTIVQPSPKPEQRPSVKKETVEQFVLRMGVIEVLPGLQLQPSRRIFNDVT